MVVIRPTVCLLLLYILKKSFDSFLICVSLLPPLPSFESNRPQQNQTKFVSYIVGRKSPAKHKKETDYNTTKRNPYPYSPAYKCTTMVSSIIESDTASIAQSFDGRDSVERLVSPSSKPLHHDFVSRQGLPNDLQSTIPLLASLSMTETLLLSVSGDVLVCRCRNASYPRENATKWQDEFAVLCCDVTCDVLNRQIEDSTAMCRGGLLGGAPAQVAHHHDHHFLSSANQWQLRGGGVDNYFTDEGRANAQQNDSIRLRAQKAFRSPPLPDTGFDEESIVPMRSFDYSHFAEGGNDMIPPPNTIFTRKRATAKAKESTFVNIEGPRTVVNASDSGPNGYVQTPLLHGVPTFSPMFSQVKITQISTHPKGSHGLLISDAGLLYSYGLNDYGQLGIGVRSSPRGSDHGFVATPTIVTPLLEHGGKAIACAAGVSHSLVVVVTEARRLIKSRSMNHMYNYDDANTSEPVVHHQMYGFGRNDFMKIGLVSPRLAKPGSQDEMECVVLPRRVALRCKVRHDYDSDTLPQGIFAVEASAEHSAALLRRSSGDVELYTWGNAMHGALGLPQASQQGSFEVSSVRIVPVPSFVASLSRTSNPDARSSSMLLRGEYPTGLSLGPHSSFVTTSEGRCFSFGISEEGMLGLGRRVRESHEPTEIALPKQFSHEFLLRVRAGASHVVATTLSGNVYSWGLKLNAGLGQSSNDPDHIQWSPMPTTIPPILPALNPERTIQAIPGFDSTIFITESGRVLSCGKASGRLGQGEVTNDCPEAKPVFGGLRLFVRTSKTPPRVDDPRSTHANKRTLSAVQ